MDNVASIFAAMPDPGRLPSPPPAPLHPPRVAGSDEPPASRSRVPFQFGLRLLLIFVTAVALVSPLVPGYGMPLLTGLVIAIVVAAPPATLGVFAFYCRGYRQTFFLGAFGASLSPLLFNAYPVRGTLGGVAAVGAIQAVVCVICGYIAVAARRFIERRGWDRPQGGA